MLKLYITGDVSVMIACHHVFFSTSVCSIPPHVHQEITEHLDSRITCQRINNNMWTLIAEGICLIVEIGKFTRSV